MFLIHSLGQDVATERVGAQLSFNMWTKTRSWDVIRNFNGD